MQGGAHWECLILSDVSHPLCGEYELLPSGWRFRVTPSQTTWAQISFTPSSITLLNRPVLCAGWVTFIWLFLIVAAVVAELFNVGCSSTVMSFVVVVFVWRELPNTFSFFMTSMSLSCLWLFHEKKDFILGSSFGWCHQRLCDITALRHSVTSSVFEVSCPPIKCRPAPLALWKKPTCWRSLPVEREHIFVWSNFIN